MNASRLIAIALMSAPILVPVAAPDAEFLTDAMKGDNSEVAMGKMAIQHSRSAQTRAYGQMLVRDHGAHKMKVAALARKMGVQPTMALTDDAMQSKQMMMGMHGSEFDTAFKQDMINDHNKDIAKYEDEVNSAQSPKVRMLAKATLPTLHKHLDAANAL